MFLLNDPWINIIIEYRRRINGGEWTSGESTSGCSMWTGCNQWCTPIVHHNSMTPTAWRITTVLSGDDTIRFYDYYCDDIAMTIWWSKPSNDDYDSTMKVILGWECKIHYDGINYYSNTMAKQIRVYNGTTTVSLQLHSRYDYNDYGDGSYVASHTVLL